jgi:hypothetical protein
MFSTTAAPALDPGPAAFAGSLAAAMTSRIRFTRSASKVPTISYSLAKLEYTAPLVRPARLAMSSSLLSEKPRSEKISDAARSNRRRTSARRGRGTGAGGSDGDWLASSCGLGGTELIGGTMPVWLMAEARMPGVIS